MRVERFFSRPRPDWNRQGPYVPPWFLHALRRIDRNLVLQFRPVRSSRNPDGVDPHLFPSGVWDICHRMPHSGMIWPRVVWSLTTSDGRYAPPEMDTIRLIRLAFMLSRNGQAEKLERELDYSLAEMNRARASGSYKRMRESLAKFASVKFRNDGGYPNRVYMRRDTARAAVP